MVVKVAVNVVVAVEGHNCCDSGDYDSGGGGGGIWQQS